MKIFDINSRVIISKIQDHQQIKDNLLDFIKNAQDSSVEDDSCKITKLDYSKNNDFNRPWVKYLFTSSFFGDMSEIVRKIGYNALKLHAIWYQQYEIGSYHGWHVHNQSYTGAYYLEFPEGSPKTQLYDNHKIITLDVKEGDISVFPSFTYHSAPRVQIDKRKTIISFNIFFDQVSAEKQKDINSLYKYNK